MPQHTTDPAINGRLPLPTPLSEAIAAGKFGLTTDGPHTPSEEELLLLVNAQIEGLVALVIEIESYHRARQSGDHLITGQAARTALRQAQNKARAGDLWREAKYRLLGHLRAYEEVFGVEAAQELHNFVLEVAASIIKPREVPSVQRELF